MVKWRCFIFMCMTLGIVEAQILNETFDDTSNFTTSTEFFSNGNRAFFGITGDSNDFGGDPIPTGIKAYEGFFGNYLTGMRLNGLGASLPITIVWENLAIQNVTQLVFRGDFAEFVDEPGHIDASDFVLVEYQIDGEGFQPLLSFVGADFSSGNFNGVFREDTNFDGVGDGLALSYLSQRFTKHIPEIGAVLDLRISMSVNAHEEDFAFDNIILTGDGVLDNTPPVILCYNDLHRFTDLDACGAIVNFSLPHAVDETDESPIVTQIEGPASGDFFAIGTTELIFEAADSSGNKSQCAIYVHIIDKQGPTATCAEPIVVYADEQSCDTIVHYDLPVATDNCSSEEEIQIELINGLGSGNYFPVGVNYETYLITDNVGNMSACSVVIEVISQMMPRLICPSEPILIPTNNAGEYILPKLEGRYGIELGDYCGQRGVYTTQYPPPSTVLQEGTHNIEINLFVNNEHVDRCIVQLLIQERLGINDLEHTEFILYPNPVIDMLHIETLEKIDNIQVYSIQGKLVEEFTAAPFSLSHFPKGVYLVRIETDNTRGFSLVVKK